MQNNAIDNVALINFLTDRLKVYIRLVELQTSFNKKTYDDTCRAQYNKMMQQLADLLGYELIKLGRGICRKDQNEYIC